MQRGPGARPMHCRKGHEPTDQRDGCAGASGEGPPRPNLSGAVPHPPRVAADRRQRTDPSPPEPTRTRASSAHLSQASALPKTCARRSVVIGTDGPPEAPCPIGPGHISRIRFAPGMRSGVLSAQHSGACGAAAQGRGDCQDRIAEHRPRVQLASFASGEGSVPAKRTCAGRMEPCRAAPPSRGLRSAPCRFLQ